MIQNEIYCYVNDFLKWKISKETGYMVGNKKFLEKSTFLISETKEKVSECKSNYQELKVKADDKGNGQDYN